jgi:hypothetical protein
MDANADFEGFAKALAGVVHRIDHAERHVGDRCRMMRAFFWEAPATMQASPMVLIFSSSALPERRTLSTTGAGRQQSALASACWQEW